MRATRYDRYRRAQNADHFAHNSPFSAFFAEVVCTLGMTPPRAVISPPPKGVCTTSMEGTARPAGPGCGTRRLRCPWAAARPGRASRRRTQPHTATQAPPVRRAPEGTEGTGALRADTPIRICHRAPLGREAGYPGGGTHAVGPGRASHSDTSAAGMEGADRTRGLRCQAAGPVGGGGAWPGFEATRRAKLAARTARGRAAAHGHTKQPGLARHTKQPGPSTRAHTPFRHNKTARPHWGRAAVAVALGFEPRVAVTPHSISSAAPSAARTRYLTRILYYMDPRSAQIDRAGWDQGHTTSQDHTAARNMGATSAYRTIENKIK